MATNLAPASRWMRTNTIGRARWNGKSDQLRRTRPRPIPTAVNATAPVICCCASTSDGAHTPPPADRPSAAS